MIVRNGSPRDIARLARAGSGGPTTPLPDVNVAPPHHCASGSKLLDHLGNQVAKRGRVVFIDVGRSGFARPFQHFSFFHEPLNSQGGQ